MAGGLDPIRYIELEQARPTRLRLFLIVIAIITAGVAFTVGITSLLGGSSGWQSVEAYPDGVDCSGDFTLQYEFIAGGADDTVSYKKLSGLYTLAMEEAYRLFGPQGGLALLNASPNTPVEVEPGLRKALEQVRDSGNRSLYLAPVQEVYDQVFLYENESEAARVDPNRDPDLADYVARTAAFSNDPAQIDLEFLDDGRVRLNVSEEYLAYAADNGIERFVDFGWMTNAFMVDHMAETLKAGGYTTGYIASYDGFTRNLDARGQSYGLNLFHRQGGEIGLPASASYTTPMSVVSLRNYPMSSADRWHYFTYSDGGITTAFVDPASGKDRSARSELTACAEEMGCAEILLEVAGIYFGEELNSAALVELGQRGICCMWFEDNVLCMTGEGLTATLTGDGKAAGYIIRN